MTFAELEYDSKKRRTRREIFLEKMEGLIPWQQLEVSTAIESCTGLAIENCTLGGGDEPLVRRFLLCSCSLSLRG